MSRTRVTSAVSVPVHGTLRPVQAIPLQAGSYPADAGHRGADEVGDAGVGGVPVGFEVFGREPAVRVGGGPLPQVQAVQADLGRLDQDRVEDLVLDDVVASPGELDRVL